MNDEWVIGVDLGGTKVEVGLISLENRVTQRVRFPTQPHLGPQNLVERIAQEVERLSALRPQGANVVSLGLCSPGPVDHVAGTLLDSPNLKGLQYAPLRQMLSTRLGIPVQIDHDAKAACLGEYYYGAGKGQRSMSFVIAGTGVGSATILNGQLLRGQNNSAGEIGHVPLDRDGELCSCGSHGCFETLVAGPWLVRRYLKKTQTSAQLNSDRTTEMTAVDVVNLALAGDKAALEVMEEAGGALGAAIATLAMLLDVDLFVVGGSVVQAGDLLLEPARRALPKHCYRSVGCAVRIVATEIGEDGHLLGCGWIARHALELARQKREPDVETGPVGPPMEETLDETHLEIVDGVIFNVQRFSVHDGPGIRTNVFLKGCPLRCAWCCNPESHRFHPELGLSLHQCIRCGQFDDICADVWSHGAITQSEKDKFSARVETCPGGAIRWLGTRRSAGDVISEVLRDQPFYRGEGGMTLTGGEPTAQPVFAEALLHLAKRAGLTTAIETCGHTRWKVFERLLPHLDLILFDLKHMNPEVHREWTGMDNEVILSNLQRMAEVGAPVTVRVPLIPGFNADTESISAIAKFVSTLHGLPKQVSLLPYHTLGRAKYASLGRPYPLEGKDPTSPEMVLKLTQILEAQNLEVSIGS
jgi:glycyl-radical enzyme activating protein/glucokinase-like ROK family protein